MLKRVGVLGSGIVGQVLAGGMLREGYAVMRGSREPDKLADWLRHAGPQASVGTFTETAEFGELVVLTVKGSAAERIVSECAAALSGKPVLDATNPIADEPPEDGVLRFFTGPNDSLMERLQRLAPEAHFVKSFSCVGSMHMVNPDFGGTRPTMFICGNDNDAKARTVEILRRFGWEVADMGGAPAARAIEPLCQLWCLPGLRHNRWNHAFKLLQSI